MNPEEEQAREADNRLATIDGLARELVTDDLEFDAITPDDISEGDDNGCWVRGWVWVSFVGTDLDKDEDDAAE